MYVDLIPFLYELCISYVYHSKYNDYTSHTVSNRVRYAYPICFYKTVYDHPNNKMYYSWTRCGTYNGYDVVLRVNTSGYMV